MKFDFDQKFGNVPPFSLAGKGDFFFNPVCIRGTEMEDREDLFGLLCTCGLLFILFVQNVTTLGLGIRALVTCPAQPMLSIYMIGIFY